MRAGGRRDEPLRGAEAPRLARRVRAEERDLRRVVRRAWGD
jgi:hypothetical protein